MNITCPYCYSENVSRETTQSSGGNSFSSMAGAGIGATISKSFPTPLSPLLGGLAGAVIGGFLLGLFEVLGGGYLPLLTGGNLGAEYRNIFAFIIGNIMLILSA